MLVDIDSLRGTELHVVRPLQAVTERIDPSNFVAQVPNAEVCASGDSYGEAIENLQDMIAVTFQYFSSLPAERLGPDPTRQLAILRQHIEKR